MKHNKYHNQVSLLVKALPIVMEDEDFALKGGTAINLFVRDMPRLSVDIDLTFIPILNRRDTIVEINRKMSETAKRLETQVEGSQATLIYTKEKVCRNIQLNNDNTVIKVEINHVLRGQVREGVALPLCDRAQSEFDVFLETKCLHFDDLYAGKICAALSRQHPRDLFDVKLLLDNEGVSDELRKVFVIYLASGNGSVSDMLNPGIKDVRMEFDREFAGMNFIEVSYKDLEIARRELVQCIKSGMTEEEKRFLLSMKAGEPEWDRMDMPHIKDLPALNWKIQNIRNMNQTQRNTLIKRLEVTLGVD